MRFRGRFTLLGLPVLLAFAVVAPAADDPAPLLKPITPPGVSLRVRFPVTPGFPKTMSFNAQVPRGKKKSELIDVTVAVETLPDKSYVTAKKLESWGYEVPKDKEFILPELVITTAQVAPKPAKGQDVVVRLSNLKLAVIDNPASTDETVYRCDISLSFATFCYGNERALEPRLSFGDKFFELTAAADKTKRPGTSDAPLPEITSSADTKLVPAYATMTAQRGLQLFSYATINGLESFKTPDNKVVPVNVLVSSITNTQSGVLVTLGLARGCKIEMDQTAGGMAAMGVDAKSEFIPGKIKELRLAVHTGPGLKTVKDIVIKDLPVMVDKNRSDSFMFVGQKFMDTYFVDGVYAGTADSWKLHGRVDPDLLQDIKMRPKPPKQ
jgi:hypothetical protein